MKETLTDTSNNATWRLAHARMYATQCLHDEAQAIEDLVSQLDENFDRAVELIYHCRGINCGTMEMSAKPTTHTPNLRWTRRIQPNMPSMTSTWRSTASSSSIASVSSTIF